MAARFGKMIKNRRDCEELAEEIQVVTTQFLSYNTIRRYFGIDKGQYKTRRQTLDVLSQYCGFDSHADFKMNYSFENNWSIKNQFYFELTALKKETIINLLRQSWSTSRELFCHQIIEVNRECLRKRDVYLFLTIIKELKFHLESLSYSDQLNVAQGTLIFLRNEDLTNIEYFTLANNLDFQSIIFSNFVDIYYLKQGYYAKLLLSMIHFGNNQMQQFYLCAKVLHNLLNNIILQDPELPVLDDSQHPILKGRIISILYWAMKNDISEAESFNLVDTIKNHYNDALFLELKTFGILFKDIKLLEKIMHFEFGVFSQEYYLMHNQIDYLSKCLVYMTQNNSELTRKWYAQINSKNVSHSHRFLFDKHLPEIVGYLHS